MNSYRGLQTAGFFLDLPFLRFIWLRRMVLPLTPKISKNQTAATAQ